VNVNFNFVVSVCKMGKGYIYAA